MTEPTHSPIGAGSMDQPGMTSLRWWWLLLIPALLQPYHFLSAADLGHRVGTQWSPYVEWSVSNPDWAGNPFDVEAEVTFLHQPTANVVRTGLFYAGDHTWRFRFTGTQPGRWTFNSSSSDPDLDGLKGSITVEPNPNRQSHGFLRKYGSKWGWQGTEEAFVPQLVMWDYVVGSNDPKVFRGRPELVDGKIKEFIGEHGFTGFHFPVVGGRWFDCGATSDEVTAALANPDHRTFEALELLITRTHAAGGMVHLWAWGDDQRSQTPRSLQGGFGGLVDQRLIRYLAARLGPIPGWSMGYGFDLDEWVSAEQLRTWRNEMHRHLGWFHFLGGRPAGPNRGTDHSHDALWNEGLDYSSYEHHQPDYAVYRAALEAIPSQPVLSEDRFRIRQSQYRDKDYSESQTRRGLYQSTLAGGVGNIWGISPELQAGGVFPNRDQLKTYAEFFSGRGRFLVDLHPANELSRDPNTRVLRSAQAQGLLLYREETDTIQVDLTIMPTPSPVVAVDTKAPYREIDLGNVAPQDLNLRLPHVSDWAIAVGRFERH